MALINKLNAIADEVRILSDTTAGLTLDEMASLTGEANTEINAQTDLLAQVAAALEGKAAGGGVELPELSNPASAADILSGKEAIDEDGNKITGSIATKTSSNLTANGATVTVPSGYYASQATKSVASGSVKTPATTVTKNPTISVNTSGLITASVSGTQSVTPTVTSGYVSSGTAGTITVSGSATKQLTTQAAKTVTPTTSNQTAVASGRYTTGAITVKGDANLKAENIKSGVSIFGVSGTHSGGENLDSVIAQQQTLINTLSSVLDSKAAGGSSEPLMPAGFGIDRTIIDLPEVDITFSISYMTYENGKIIPKHETMIGGSVSYVLQSAPICNSIVTITQKDYLGTYASMLYGFGLYAVDPETNNIIFDDDTGVELVAMDIDPESYLGHPHSITLWIGEAAAGWLTVVNMM